MLTSGVQKVSFQLDQDSAFDIGQFIAARVGQSLGRGIARAAWLSVLWGGAKGTRTPDPLLAKQVLFQLSYSPELRRSKGTWAGTLALAGFG
jgi:hypothetical protein